MKQYLDLVRRIITEGGPVTTCSRVDLGCQP